MLRYLPQEQSYPDSQQPSRSTPADQSSSSFYKSNSIRGRTDSWLGRTEVLIYLRGQARVRVRVVRVRVVRVRVVRVRVVRVQGQGQG